MSVGYKAVQWTRFKVAYDLVALALLVAFLAGFVVVGTLRHTGENAIGPEVLVLRALGVSAFVLLHAVLLIGPLARLDTRFAPLLANRRHLGVLTFSVGLLHGVFATLYYHGFGTVNPLVSLLSTNTEFASVSGFPFQILGALALAILFVLAATSHDFWNANLGPGWWKTLHMLVYAAYALLVLHVALGAVQSEPSPIVAGSLGLGVLLVGSAHIAAALKQAGQERPTSKDDGWVDAGELADIAEGRAVIVRPEGCASIAVFKHEGQPRAMENRCAHQGGPLGEGRVVDGCVTCPWHGWQYRPEDGVSPPPFDERVRTFETIVHDGRVLVRVLGNDVQEKPTDA